MDAKITLRDAKIAYSDAKITGSDVKIACSDAKIAFRDAKITFRDAKIAFRDVYILSKITKSALLVFLPILSAVQAQYGADSSEYEQAGGTRQSERRRPTGRPKGSGGSTATPPTS